MQPWGRDGDKRRFWLIEGQDDTHFRLYRESNPVLKHNTWRSVAGTIEELKEVANLLGEEGSQASRRLQDRILLAIPRFEASEEVYRLQYVKNAIPRSLSNAVRRNGNEETTVTPVKPNLSVQTQGSPCTKAAHVGSGSGIPFPMKRREDPMLSQRGAQIDSQAYRRQLSRQDLLLLRVADKSDLGSEEHMGK